MRKNLFMGNSYFALYARVVYRQLMTQEWVSYGSVIREYYGSKEPPGSKNTLAEGYKQLKKAFTEVRKAIGVEQFESRGKSHTKDEQDERAYRYIGDDPDPLLDMRSDCVKASLEEYVEFCQDSSGFMPESWLRYFLEGTYDLLDIQRKRKAGRIMFTDMERGQSDHIDWIPLLYERIKKRQVLDVRYKPFGEEEQTKRVHPHCLCEFNRRWFLLGRVEGEDQKFPYVLAVDRMQDEPKWARGVEWKFGEEPEFYAKYLECRVGVSRMIMATVQRIRVRAYNVYMDGLIATKPLHRSQHREEDFGEHKDGTYGEFELELEPNNEFYGRVLQFGAGLEVMSPPEVRDELRKRAQELWARYADDTRQE